jgi:DNA ligase (NAD+)
MIRLRDYQERFVSGVQASFLEYTKVLGVMPTGAGKTIAFASLLQNYNRTLVLAHIEELIDQAVDKIKTVTGLNVSVEMGERTSLDTDVVVASIQSMFRRKEQFDRNQFDLIICDEAHYSLSPTWQSVLRYFADARNVEMLGRLKSYGLQMSLSEKKLQAAGDSLKGLSIVISGTFSKFSRDEYKAMIEQNGGKNTGSVSAKTSFILAGENMGPEKLKKAESLGVKLINEDEFLSMLGNTGSTEQEFTGTLF